MIGTSKWVNGVALIKASLVNALGSIINPATEEKQDDIIANQTDGSQRTKILDEDGNVVGVQYPFSTDGDSVYSKDVDTDNSSVGTFSGLITDLVDDLHSTLTDTGVTNPKEITIVLKRPIITGEFRLCTGVNNFSNVKIICKDRSGAAVLTIDDSSNNTKYTSYEYTGTPTPFCTILIQFHTADTVSLDYVDISKTLHVSSHLHALKPDGTITPIDATSGGNLKVSIEEYDDATNPVRSDLDGGGKVAVGTSAVEATFTGSTTSVIITSDKDNTGILYVGKSDVDSSGNNALTYLRPDDTITLGYDDSSNALYVVADTVSQNFWKGSLL